MNQNSILLGITCYYLNNCHPASLCWHLRWNTLKARHPCIKQRWNYFLPKNTYFKTCTAARILSPSSDAHFESYGFIFFWKITNLSNCCYNLLWPRTAWFQENQKSFFAWFCLFWIRIHATQDPCVNCISKKNILFYKKVFFCD